MDKVYDVVALGEILIDFTQNGESEQGNVIFEANPGGAPSNVLAMLQKLGKNNAFIGKVGKDSFGYTLEKTLKESGISTKGLCFDDNIPTTLAFVHKQENGDRDFSFYRNPGADMCLNSDDIGDEIISIIENSKIFHFGTLSMTDESVLNATKKAINIAKDKGLVLSFDPNLRLPLWKDINLAKNAFDYGMCNCDILKISDNEIEWFTGETDVDKGINRIIEKYNIPLVMATLGVDGSKAYYKGSVIGSEAIKNLNPIDTTGAGDTFCGCCLNTILEVGINNLTDNDIQKMLKFANAAASLITNHKGAFKSMPKEADVKSLNLLK